MSNKPPIALQRGDAAPNAEHRRKVLEQAKRRAEANGARPAPMEGTPSFEEVEAAGRAMRRAPGADHPPEALSASTAAGLEAVAAATAAAAASAPVEDDAPAPELDEEAVGELLQCDVQTARRVLAVLRPDVDENARARRAIEGRIRVNLDIGQFIANGVLTQPVPIIAPSEALKAGLVVVFQTTTDGVESLVDRLLADEAAKIRKIRGADGESVDVEMSRREFIRRQNEYAVAVHIRSYAGRDWPSLVGANGNIDEGALGRRLAFVREIPSPILTMIINNLGWFLERVQSTLDVAVLGNG